MSGFPGYDVLSQREAWDRRTREVVLARLSPGPRRFFTPDEERHCRPLLDALLANDGRRPRVPIFELVDQRLAAGSTDGWRYEDMPPDAEAWRRSADELAVRSFATLGAAERAALLESVRTGDRFAGMPAPRLWKLWMRYACTAYYAHPWAWSEIGFGGPAYPRGYKALGVGRREPWEAAERGAADPVPRARRLAVRRERRA